MNLTTIILTVFTIVLILVFVILINMQWQTQRKIAKIKRSLLSKNTNMIFSFLDIEDLPELARRYFLHSIKSGTPLAKTVKIKMSGYFRTPRSQWQNLEAQEIISYPKGFLWEAKIFFDRMKLSGADYYFNGFARVYFQLWGLLPIINIHNPDTAKSALARFASELVFLPSAFVLEKGITWRQLNDNQLQANWTINGEPINLMLEIAGDGRLTKVSLMRWGNPTETESYSYIPFGATFEAERSFDGYTIPAQIRVGWWLDSDKYFDFFQAKIEQAEFN